MYHYIVASYLPDYCSMRCQCINRNYSRSTLYFCINEICITKNSFCCFSHIITMKSHEHHGILNQQQLDCLFNSLFPDPLSMMVHEIIGMNQLHEKLPQKHISMKFYSKLKYFHSIKCICKISVIIFYLQWVNVLVTPVIIGLVGFCCLTPRNAFSMTVFNSTPSTLWYVNMELKNVNWYISGLVQVCYLQC